MVLAKPTAVETSVFHRGLNIIASLTQFLGLWIKIELRNWQQPVKMQRPHVISDFCVLLCPFLLKVISFSKKNAIKSFSLIENLEENTRASVSTELSKQ